MGVLTGVGLPFISGVVAADGTITMTDPTGQSFVLADPFPDRALEASRRLMVQAVATLARAHEYERVRARLTDTETGTTDMVITADGQVEDLDAADAITPASFVQPTPAAPTFLADPTAQMPAQTGVRGAVNRLGLRLPPGPQEMDLRHAVRLISQHWPGPRRVAVVNGKGSANKTPTSALLGAAFAIHGGGGVAVMDNNPNRGTLGWRTEQGPHASTVVDLVPHISRLLGADASAADIGAFMHHQSEDRYDVLRSRPDKLGAPITPEQFLQVVRTLSKYHRLTVFDSGNDESTAVWRRMIDVTDQLVVATVAMNETAEAGRLLLHELSQRDAHGARLAANAVVIVSQSKPRRPLSEAQDIAARFDGLARATAVIPYDAQMVEGHLRWRALSPATQEAWIHAAAAVATGF